MISIKFKNLEKSDMIKEIVHNRFELILSKFPDLQGSIISILLEMENSRKQAGKDSFKVKIYIKSGRYKGITLEKKNLSFHLALADVYEHMLEILNRFGDKNRMKNRKSKKHFVTFEEELSA